MSRPLPPPVRRLAPAVAVLPVLVTLLPLRGLLRAPIAPQDEGVVLTYPGVWLHGGVPNGTFESVYGASWIWTMATAFVAFGHSLVVERTVGIAYRLVMVLAVCLLLRRHGWLTAAVAGALTGAVSVAAFGSAVPVFGATAFALLAVWAGCEARERASARFALVAGAAAGAALGFRPDFALPVVAGAAVVCLGWRREQARAAVAGLVVSLLPVWVELVRAGLRSTLRGELLDPVLVFPAGRHLPFSGLETDVAVSAVGTAVVALAAVLVSWRGVRRGDDAARRLLGLAVLSLALVPYMTSRWDPPHVGFVVMTSIALLPATARTCLRTRWPSPRAVRVVVALAVAGTLVACIQAFWPPYRDLVKASYDDRPVHRVSNEGREVVVASASDRRDLQALLADVERAAPTGHPRLAVLPGNPAVTFYNDTFLYFLLPRFRPSTYYLEMEPGVANGSRSRLAEDLRHTDVVITNARYQRSGEPNDASRVGSLRATRVLGSDFREVARHGPWRLLLRR